MTGKSHVTIGLLTYTSLWAHSIGPFNAPLLGGTRSVLALPVALAIVALASLLPDLDHPEGRLANERVLGIPILKPFAWIIHAIFGHRGVTHSLLVLVGIVLLGNLPGLPWAWANLGLLVGWGYAFHLLADSLTKSGIPLLWPLDFRFGLPPIRSLRFATGSWREGFTVAFLTLACIANAVRYFLN